MDNEPDIMTVWKTMTDHKLCGQSVERVKKLGMECPEMEGKSTIYAENFVVDNVEEILAREKAEKQECEARRQNEYLKSLKEVNYTFRKMTPEQEKAEFARLQSEDAKRPHLPHPPKVSYPSKSTFIKAAKENQGDVQQRRLWRAEFSDYFNPTKDDSPRQIVRKLGIFYINVGNVSSGSAEFGIVEKFKDQYSNILNRLPVGTEIMYVPVREGQTRLEFCNLE